MIIKAVPAGVLCGRSSSSAPPQPPEQRCEIDGEPPATRRQTTIGSSTAVIIGQVAVAGAGGALAGALGAAPVAAPMRSLCARRPRSRPGRAHGSPAGARPGSWATGRRSPAHRPARSDSSTAGSREMINRLSKGSPIEESGFIIRDTA